MYMKNPNDPIGKQTPDLPGFTAGSQPTSPLLCIFCCLIVHDTEST